MDAIDNTSTPHNPAPFWDTVLRFGGYCGLVLVGISLLSYLMGFSPMSLSAIIVNSLIALGITIGFAAVAIKHQRDQLDGGYIKYGRGLLVGMFTVAIAVLISSIWNYVLFNFVDPGYVDKMKEDFANTWGDKMPAEAMETQLEQFDKMGDLSTIFTQGIIGALFLGLIAGLIAAAIMKRDRPLV